MKRSKPLKSTLKTAVDVDDVDEENSFSNDLTAFVSVAVAKTIWTFLCEASSGIIDWSLVVFTPILWVERTVRRIALNTYLISLNYYIWD